MDTLRSVIAVTAVVLVGGAVANAQTREAELLRSRQQMSAVEGALERAIASGARTVLEQLPRTAMPERWKLTSVPRASGARLPGDGVVFHVQVPDLQPPLQWTLRQIAPEAPNEELMSLQRWRTAASTMQERVAIDSMILELEQRIATGNARGTEVGRGSISAASVVPSVPPTPAQKVLNDPDDAYTGEVKAALIQAMLKQTHGLELSPDESLTVIARTSAPPNPLLPADSTYLSTWVMRVKGTTLSAFRAGKITEQEAVKAVEVLEQ